MAETMAFNYNMGISSTNIVATGIAIYRKLHITPTPSRAL